MEEKKIKRRPGRPRIVPLKKSQPRTGVTNTPSNAGNVVEISYSEPSNLETLWKFYKHMTVETHQLIFRKETLTMYGKDHDGQSHVYVKINGNKLNRFYCKEPLEIGLARNTMAQYIKTIDRGTEKVSIISRGASCKKNIRMIFRTPIGAPEDHKIDVIGEYDRLGNEKKEEEFICEDDYMISFKLPWKYFKKKYKDLKYAESTQMIFTQDDCDSPLAMKYTDKSRKGSSKILFNDYEKINFVSKLEKDETFRVSIVLEDLKAISTSLMADTIQIYLDERKDMLLVADMDDGTIEVRVLIKIVDNRDGDDIHTEPLTGITTSKPIGPSTQKLQTPSPISHTSKSTPLNPSPLVVSKTKQDGGDGDSDGGDAGSDGEDAGSDGEDGDSDDEDGDSDGEDGESSSE